MKKTLFALMCAIILFSCKSAEFTIVSTKPIEMNQQYTLKKSGAVGKSIDLQTAIDKCIEAGGGTYITNVKVYEGLFRWKVVGDVYGK